MTWWTRVRGLFEGRVMPMGATQKAADKEGARSFARFIEQVDDGQAVIEISADMHKLLVELKEVAERSGNDAKGAIAVQFAFNVAANGVVDIVYNTATKGPKRKFARSTFFLTAGANLSTENPRQQKLPGLRDVPSPREYADVDEDDERAARDV